MPNTTDNLMTLADGLVEALSAGDFSLPFTAEWIDNPIVELADPELLTTRVWVVDFAEKQELFQGIPVEEYELLLVVQKRFGPEEVPAEQCRNLSGLVSEIARFCRNTMLEVDSEGAVCVKIERERSRDFKDYNEKGLFRAEISTHWRKVGGDDDE
jgi:hypothetical protein